MPRAMTHFPAHLECSACSFSSPIKELVNVCPNCKMPLLVKYDLRPDPQLREKIRARAADMWRYREVLPVDEGDIVTLGEGVTPALRSNEFPNVVIKDESKNPTRSFKS